MLSKLVDGLGRAIETIRGFFGDTPTVSQNWVTNIGEIHDTLAWMYAERFGTPVEREQAKLAAIRDRAARDAFVATPPAAPGTPEAAAAHEALTTVSIDRRRLLQQWSNARKAAATPLLSAKNAGALQAGRGEGANGAGTGRGGEAEGDGR